MSNGAAENLNVTQEGLGEQDQKKLEEIVKQINELKDNNEGTKDDVENMKGVLTAEFAKMLKPETATQLLNAITNKYKPNDTMPEGLQDLINFLEPIANTISQSIEGGLTQDAGTFKSKLDKREGNNESELDKFGKKRNEKGKEWFPNGEEITDERLTRVKETISKIKYIIKYPNKENTNALQKFIYENLDEWDKKVFSQENHLNSSTGDFDGKFGKSTLSGLDKVLEKMEKYVTDVKESIAVEGKNKPVEAVESLDNVTVRNEINLPDGEVEAKDLLNNLPSGAEVSFEGGDSIDKSKSGQQEVIVLITSGGKSKEITIIATVENDKIALKEKNPGTTPTSPESVPQRSTAPLELNGEKYPVANDNLTLKYNQVLYNINPLDNIASGGNQPMEAQNKLPEMDANGDREYLMHTKDGDYKVKLDNQGNLKPLVENFNSGVKVLLKNNPSCITYLQNKIPDGLPGNPIIVWNSKLEDYAIRSDATNYREGLTIEPMGIDGHGVSPDLSELLVMMNFVNYLRFNKKIDNIDFDNNDPDLRLNDQGKLEVRVDRKSNRTYDEKGNVVKNGRWYEVPDRFGLSGINPERIKNLIKFNNGENWRDKWDKKKGNKYYDKMALPKAEIQAVNPTTPVAPDVGHVQSYNPGVKTTNTDQITDVTPAPTTTETYEGTHLDEVVVVGNRLKPKEPINFGSDSEELMDSKTGELGGVGKFDGNGNFKFEGGIKERTETGGNKTIAIGNYTYTMINYEQGTGMNIPQFTGKGYQVGNTGEMKWFYIGDYKEEQKSGNGTRIFENGAMYKGEWSDGRENGNGEYIYPNGDKYVGEFKDGKFNGTGIYTWGNGLKYEGKFKDDNMIHGKITINNVLYDVKNDGKGLVITEGDSTGKYVDIKKGTVEDVSTSTTETVDLKSYGSIGEAVENGKVKNEAIREENGNKYVMVGNEKYFYYVGKPNELSPKINYCIQYEGKLYFGKLNVNNGDDFEGGQYVDKDGNITTVKTNLTAADEETVTPAAQLDLSQYRNSDSKIDLSSLTTLTKAQAEILATTKGNLILDGLKTIDADIAEELNKHEGFLSLNGLENLSKDVADKFKNRKSTMSFDSIKKFEQGVSEFIGTSEGGLSLAGLEEISNEDAKNIGNHKGIMIHENDSFNNTITLSSLKHITPEQAKLLGKFEGEIQLNGLESLDEQIAKELANSQLSQIYFGNPEFDKLVREINPEKIPQYVDMGG